MDPLDDYPEQDAVELRYRAAMDALDRMDRRARAWNLAETNVERVKRSGTTAEIRPAAQLAAAAHQKYLTAKYDARRVVGDAIYGADVIHE